MWPEEGRRAFLNFTFGLVANSLSSRAPMARSLGGFLCGWLISTLPRTTVGIGERLARQTRDDAGHNGAELSNRWVDTLISPCMRDHMNIGIAPYLEDLARRYAELAKRCLDQRIAFQLQGLSIELSRIAHELAQALKVKSTQRAG